MRIDKRAITFEVSDSLPEDLKLLSIWVEAGNEMLPNINACETKAALLYFRSYIESVLEAL